MATCLGLDIGSNSVGSAWVDTESGEIRVGISIFPAGVEESEEKRGEPRNAKRRMGRRTRVTLARRSARKRLLRVRLIEVGLLPPNDVCRPCSRKDTSSRNAVCCFKRLLQSTDPWELRRKGLDEQLSPFEFGRVLLHLAQRRGALGLHLLDPDEDETNEAAKEEGKVKKAIREVQAKMQSKKARTFGEFIAMLRAERITPITSEDKRAPNKRKGPREWRKAVRNKAASYDHCADRGMIRCEFTKLWEKQSKLGGETGKLLTPELRLALDDESRDARWRHRGLLFGQRAQSWDLGTLGRCALHPEERCVPHADMYASRYLVVETVNNLKIEERGKPRPLTPEERDRIKAYLSEPLGMETPRKKKGQIEPPAPRAKRTVNVQDLRAFMGSKKDGWGRATKTSNPRFRFNIETNEDREINTDWFSREIIHGAVTPQKWQAMSERQRDGLNRAILKYDPDEEEHASNLKTLGMKDWLGLTAEQADAVVAAWKQRPRLDAKRLNMSRRAVRNLLTLMDRVDPWPDDNSPTAHRWLTQIEARKHIAGEADFRDATSGQTFQEEARRLWPNDGQKTANAAAVTRRRYATGAKGATARDRYYMRQGKHWLRDESGQVIRDADGNSLAAPPAPMLSNPVVRKAIHEVRRHLIEYMVAFERKPDRIYVELSREARMGKMDVDRFLFKNRLRNRIRKEIIEKFVLDSRSSTQQNEAVRRVVLCVQQGGVCPLCGNQGVKTTITERIAANGEDCEIAHIIPRGVGGDNRYTNIVLAHRKCNRDMGRRTPRKYWEATLPGGFAEGMQWIERIYGDIKRIKLSETKKTTGPELWKCYLTEPARPKRGALPAKPPNYFSRRFDKQVIEQFRKDVTDIQQMTTRQDAATKYAARQVMAYLADALYDGQGLPERGGPRRIYASDGFWTNRLCREWGLFFDRHKARSHGLSSDEEHRRNQKDRGDHRHHAIDAVVIALCTRQVQLPWEERERRADMAGINTANDEAMDNYRRNNPLPPPPPFKSREQFRDAVRRAVFGDTGAKRPVCHRPVQRKLTGELHEAFPRGPILGNDGEMTDKFTKRISVLELKPNHLRVPQGWDELSAKLDDASISDTQKRSIRKQLAAMPDPSPGKSGIVRDRSLRDRLRKCLRNDAHFDLGKLDPKRNIVRGGFRAKDVKQAVAEECLRHKSGVPVRAVVLLWTISDPIVIQRKRPDYRTTRMLPDENPAAKRAYIGGNQHHIEVRVSINNKGQEVWSGRMVNAFEAARRMRARLGELRAIERPIWSLRRPLTREERRALSPAERRKESERRKREWKQRMRKLRPQRSKVIAAHPIVDRFDAEQGRFVMSLCEGEMLHMKHKHTGEVDYFVVAKLDKPRSIVLVPHWDARSATGRKDADGRKVSDSKREQFTITPSDLKKLSPPGYPHAMKVRVSPLGNVTVLVRD